MQELQKSQFEERLKRIASGGPNTMGQVYVGPAEEPIMRDRKASAPINNIATNMQYPLTIIGAFLIGCFAVFFSRYVRFHVLGGELTGENADLWMLADGIFALAVVFALRSLFRFDGKVMETAKTVGIIAMLGIMHNFVHMAPMAFSNIFSKEWVAEVVATTEPKSILFRGISFVIDPQEREKSAVPTRVELKHGGFARAR